MGEGPGGLGERGPPGALPVTMLNLILPVTVPLSAVRYSCCLLVLVVVREIEGQGTST